MTKCNNKTGVISDPLGHTHSLDSSNQCFRFKFVLFWKVGMDGQTDNMCKNNDQYQPGLWVSLVDRKETLKEKKNNNKKGE